MTNAHYQTRGLAGHVVQQTEWLHADFFQNPDRRRVIGSYQSEHFWHTQCIERQRQGIASDLGGIALPPGLHGESITEVDAPHGQIVERCNAAETDDLLGALAPRNRPPAVALAGPLLDQSAQQTPGVLDTGHRAGRIEQVGLGIAEDGEQLFQVFWNRCAVDEA